MAQVNPKVRNIVVPAAGAAPVIIAGTMLASKVVVMEDPNANNGVAQGLTGYFLDPTSNPANPTQDPQVLQTWLPQINGGQGPAYQPIILGGTDGRVHGGEGNYVGAQNTPYLSLNSATNLPTAILLQEWP